jgi:hypothetical protein
MTREEFFQKYPRPWRFERTDRSGGGFICDANGLPLVLLDCDYDWDEHNESLPEPVFCVLENDLGNADIIGPKRIERDKLIGILTGAEE